MDATSRLAYDIIEVLWPWKSLGEQAVSANVNEIIRELSRSGIGVLITDHNVRETLSVTDRAYILRNGKIFRKGRPDELSNDPEVRRVYLGDHFRLN